MILLIGASALVVGFVGYVYYQVHYDDGGPDWLFKAAALSTWLMPPGLGTFLVGLGLWLAQPHIWRF